MSEPRVFISYQRSDESFARTVREHLAAHDVITWMDQYDIPVGAYWPDEIDKGLAASDIVVGILSPDSVESRNVKNEWDWAIQNDKRLLLVQVKPCVIPHRYVSINFIDASGSDINRMISSLLTALGVDSLSVPTSASGVSSSSGDSIPVRHSHGRAGPRLLKPLVVGRDSELELLRRSLDELHAGQGSLILVGGEAGIGKTTLTNWLLAEAEERGVLALSGGCYDLATTPPYGPWTEIIRAWPMDPSLPPVPDALRGGEALSRIHSQAALFDVVSEFLTSTSDARPLLLLLEDLHWADQASLDLLRYVARMVASQRIVLVSTWRDDEVTRKHPLYGLLPSLAREQRAELLTLHRLGSSALHGMIAARYQMNERDITRLTTYLEVTTEGNPLFAVEVLRSLQEAGTIIRAADGNDWILDRFDHVQVPVLVRQVIGSRLERLGDDARRVLSVAAVIGSEIPVDLLMTVSGEDDLTLSETLERAVESRLIEEARGGDSFHFTHALIRETLYESMVSLRRRLWHRKVAEVIEQTKSPDPDTVAYHFQQGGDMRAFDWLIRAGERAQRSYALTTAIERFEDAAVLAERDDHRLSDRAWVLYRVARLLRTFDPHRGIGFMDEALALADQAEDRILQAFIPFDMGHLLAWSGDVGRAIPQMRAGLDALATLPIERVLSDPPTLVWIANSLPARDSKLTVDVSDLVLTSDIRMGTYVIWSVLAGFIEEAFGVGPALIDRLRKGGRSPILESSLSDACGGLIIAHSLKRQPEQTRGLYQWAIESHQAIGHFQQVAIARSYELNEVVLPFDTLNLDRRDQLEAEIIADLRRTWANSWNSTLLSDLYFLEGRWGELRDYVQHIQLHLDPSDPVIGLSGISILWALGDTDTIDRLVARQFTGGPETDPGNSFFKMSIRLQQMQIQRLIASDDSWSALPWLEAHDRWLDWAGDLRDQSQAALLWARYLRSSGDYDAARQRTTDALRLAAEPRQPLDELASQRFFGELETDVGRYVEADRWLRQSLALTDACRAPFERALTLLALAELDAARGYADAARTTLGEVRAICEPLDARPTLERVAALEQRIGVPP